LKSAHSTLKRDLTAFHGAFGILLAGSAIGMLLQAPLVTGTALVLSLVTAASVWNRGPMMQTAPAKAQTDLKTLGDTR
jgi:hypothetical protein